MYSYSKLGTDFDDGSNLKEHSQMVMIIGQNKLIHAKISHVIPES